MTNKGQNTNKKILKILVTSGGKVTSRTIAQKLGIPLTIAQRRRKRLEKEYLNMSCSLKLNKFGWRIIELLIATEHGLTSAVGKAIFGRKETFSVSMTIGQHTIDLKAEIAVKDNGQLLDIIEEIQKMRGVKDVMWIEMIREIGRKAVPAYVIDKI